MKNNLLMQILIAFVLAIILGVVIGDAINIVQPLGDLFLRMIKFIMVPLILSSLVVGVASTGDPKVLGRIGIKAIAFFLITGAIAVTIALFIGSLFLMGGGLEIAIPTTDAAPTEVVGIIATLLAIVPTNPFESLVQGSMLQIIFFAIFLGLGITMVGDKAKPVLKFFEGFAEIMYKITAIVMKFAPIGIFGLLAPIIAQYGLAILLPLIKVILAIAVASIIHVLFIYSGGVKIFGKMNPIKFFKGIAPASLVAFSTCSSAGTLPVTMKCTEENLGVSKKISSFVLPLGATVNMDGTAIYQGVAALFIASVFGIELSFLQLLTIVLTATLASIGAAGVPGAGLVMLTMVLTSVGIPLEGIALIAGIDRVLDMMRTAVNVTGDAAGAVIISATEGDEEFDEVDNNVSTSA